MEWPLIGCLEDEIWPADGLSHIRYTSRALLENQDGLFGFLHIQGEDFFGKRNHLETIGGGIEKGEEPEDAMVREILEEAGYRAINVEPVGVVIDSYNLIYRLTNSYFFHVTVDTNNKLETHRTEEETLLISEILWLTKEEVLQRLCQCDNPVDYLVHRRDLLAFQYWLEQNKASE